MPEKYAKRMSRWQRDLLAKKLMEINEVIKHRKWVVSLYEKILREKGMKTVVLSEEYEPVYLRYPFLVKNSEKVLNEAKKSRIELGDWFFSPLYSIREGLEQLNYRRGMCPVAEKICEHIVNLPTHQRIGSKEAKEIVEFLYSHGNML
jgi:dTDP-4-amino-4,6-dideoxygalactose transaminase